MLILSNVVSSFKLGIASQNFYVPIDRYQRIEIKKLKTELHHSISNSTITGI